jgi:hypothetical protein
MIPNRARGQPSHGQHSSRTEQKLNISKIFKIKNLRNLKKRKLKKKQFHWIL